MGADPRGSSGSCSLPPGRWRALDDGRVLPGTVGRCPGPHPIPDVPLAPRLDQMFFLVKRGAGTEWPGGAGALPAPPGPGSPPAPITLRRGRRRARSRLAVGRGVGPGFGSSRVLAVRVSWPIRATGALLGGVAGGALAPARAESRGAAVVATP